MNEQARLDKILGGVGQQFQGFLLYFILQKKKRKIHFFE